MYICPRHIAFYRFSVYSNSNIGQGYLQPAGCCGHRRHVCVPNLRKYGRCDRHPAEYRHVITLCQLRRQLGSGQLMMIGLLQWVCVYCEQRAQQEQEEQRMMEEMQMGGGRYE